MTTIEQALHVDVFESVRNEELINRLKEQVNIDADDDDYDMYKDDLSDLHINLIYNYLISKNGSTVTRLTTFMYGQEVWSPSIGAVFKIVTMDNTYYCAVEYDLGTCECCFSSNIRRVLRSGPKYTVVTDPTDLVSLYNMKKTCPPITLTLFSDMQ